MAIEVLALELLNLSVPTSFYPPAAILFCVILLLGVAALLVPVGLEHFGPAQNLLPPTLAAAGVSSALMPIILLSFGAARTAEFVYAATFAGFLMRMAGYTLVSLGPAILFCGLTFPLAMSLCSGGGRAAGRKLGRLLAVNGLGGVVGAEAARLLMVPALGVHVTVGVVGIGYAMAALAVGLCVKGSKALRWAIPGIGLAVSVLLTAKWLAALPLFYWDDAFSVLEVRPGPEGVLTVFEREGFGRGLAFNNQYLLGGSGVLDDEQRQSHIPLLLHPSPERVCYAGLGTGITASGSLTLGNLRVELDAGLNLIVGKPGTRYSYASDGNPYLGFVKERRAAWPTDDSIPDRYRDLLEVGFLVSRLEVAYDMKHPGTAQLEAQLRSQFPVNVLTDPGSDWSLWAGNEATLSSLRSSTAPPANPPAAAP